MKFYNTIVTSLFVIASLTSCSSDDDNSNTDINFSGDFFPSTIDNQWNYEVETLNSNDEESVLTNDLLTVLANDGTKFNVTVENNITANGFMNTILTTGDLITTNTSLISSGIISLPINGIDVFSFEYDNAILFNTSADENEELASISETINRDVQGIPLTVTFTLTSTQLENIERFTANNTNYDIVTSSNISLSLELSTSTNLFGTNQTITLLEKQDVLNITNYFAKDVGLILSDASFNYQLNNTVLSTLSQLGLDTTAIPTSVTIENTQTLIDFTVL